MSGQTRAPLTLVLTTSYPRSEGDFGGHFVRAHARSLARAGGSVRVLTFGSRARGAPDQSTEGVDVVWLGGGSLFGAPGVLTRFAERPARALLLAWPLLRALWALRRRPRYDRIVAHFLLLSGWPLGVLFARRPGVRPTALEIVAHGSDVRLFEVLPRWLRRRILGDLARSGAELRFVSRELRERMIRASCVPLLERYVAAQPISPATLEMPELPTKPEARTALGLEAHETLLLIVGRLTDDKRIDVALSAAALIPNVRLMVIGDGPERARLASLHPQAVFVGETSRPAALTWMCAADLLLSASRLEGAPTTVREARILGVPVVATAAGDLTEWAKEDAGIWVVG